MKKTELFEWEIQQFIVILGEHFPQCWFRDKPVCQVHSASFFTLFVSLIYFFLPVILTLPQSVCSHAHKGSLMVKQFGQQLLHNKYHTGFLFLNRLCSISENSNIYLVASIVAVEMLVLTVSCTQTGLVLIRLSFVYLTYWAVLTRVETCTCFPPVLKNHVSVINVPSCLQDALIVCISESIPPSVNSSICSLFLAPSPVFVCKVTSPLFIYRIHMLATGTMLSVLFFLFNFGSVWLVHFVFTLTGSCNLIIQP